MPLEKTVQDLDDHLVSQPTEMGEIMGNLDNDKLDRKTNMSAIDLNTRLTENQISDCLIIDTLTRMGLFPKNDLTRQLKRLAVSKNGLGREEKVRMVQGDRDNKSGGGMLGKFSNLFRRQE